MRSISSPPPSPSAAASTFLPPRYPFPLLLHLPPPALPVWARKGGPGSTREGHGLLLRLRCPVLRPMRSAARSEPRRPAPPPPLQQKQSAAAAEVGRSNRVKGIDGLRGRQQVQESNGGRLLHSPAFEHRPQDRNGAVDDCHVSTWRLLWRADGWLQEGGCQLARHVLLPVHPHIQEQQGRPGLHWQLVD